MLLTWTLQHQVSECATLVQPLLGRCPWLRIIATSREPLRVRGETVWRVPPLDLPPDGAAEPVAGHEAVHLFAARAVGPGPASRRPGQHGFGGQAVPHAGRHTAGIELFAGRVALCRSSRSRPAARPVAARGLGHRTAPLRQQTLRATVDWSYELLDEQEQILLGRLVVFFGWNLDMAEQVCRTRPSQPTR